MSPPASASSSRVFCFPRVSGDEPDGREGLRAVA